MRLVIAGAGGRMGRTLVKAVAEMDGVVLAGALERAGSPLLGRDAGVLAGMPEIGIAVTEDAAALLAGAHGLVDFTTPDATVADARLAADAGIVHVVGTTGLGEEHEAALRAAARDTAIVRSGNMSLGVNLLAALVAKAAAALGADWDIEILEMHHRHKVDAPSGTALLLGQAAAAGRGRSLEEVSVRARDGQTGARPPGAIGFQALRGGSVVGEHQVVLAGEGERVTLGHIAEDRAIFARGALKAALWARGRAPGLYSMADVLGLAG